MQNREGRATGVDIVANVQPIMHTPGVCGGRACIRRTRIPVWTVVNLRQMGADDVEVLDDYPSLTPSDLAAAWAYHAAHAPEIDSDIADQERDD